MAFSDYVREYLDKESKETGVPVSNLVSLIVSNSLREKKKSVRAISSGASRSTRTPGTRKS